MRPIIRAAVVASSALAALSLVSFRSAGAQMSCAPADRAVSAGAARTDGAAILQRRISLQARDISLRAALDRIAAAAGIRISYSAEALRLDRLVCLDYESAPLAQVFSDLLGGAVKPVVVGADQVALTPFIDDPASPSSAVPRTRTVSELDRVIVTGITDESVRRESPIAMDVVSGEQIARRGSRTLSGSLDGVVPGLWLWEQSPLSMLSGYGSIRGASSFGVSYPKVYVDGVEVANSLLVTHLDPDAVARIEVIRGPQGAALYGADAISGVMNIVTRHEGPEPGAPGLQVRTQGGASASDYSASQVFAQSHAATFRNGDDARSARLGMTATRIGAFVPDAFSQQLSASGNLRYVRSRGVITGMFRLFAHDARNPSGSVLPGAEAVSGTQPGPATMDSTRSQAVRQYTLGATAVFSPGERWTHSAVAGIDGYTLKSALSNGAVFPSAIDSALADATGSAVRASLRASSVARFGDPARASATVTMTAEHSVVRDAATTHPSSLSATSMHTVESRSNTGVVGQVATAFNDAVFLTAGLRVERNSALNVIGEFATLPMLGASVVRSFGSTTIKVRSAYGKGIRPVQSRSRTGAIPALRGTLPGSTLAPEEQSGKEFGADAFLGEGVGLHITRFDQRASGLVQPVSVVARVTTPDGQRITQLAYELQNVGVIANSGWELKASLREGPWSAAATFSQVRSTVEELGRHYTGDLQPGDRMLEVPARTLGITTAFIQPRWFASLTVSRASDWINYDRLALLDAFTAAPAGEAPYGPELRSFWRTYDGVTRAAARIELDVSRGMTFTVDAENLLDEQRGEPDNVTVLPGRTVSAGLRVSF